VLLAHFSAIGTGFFKQHLKLFVGFGLSLLKFSVFLLLLFGGLGQYGYKVCNE